MKHPLFLITALPVVLGSLSLTLGNSAPLAAKVAAEAPAMVLSGEEVTEALQAAPLMFIENVGQFEAGARFQLRGADGTLWLADRALWITVVEPLALTENSEQMSRATPDEPQALAPQRGANIRLSFVGANPQPKLEPFNSLATTVSYFKGNNPERWRPDVPVWGGVRYVDLYPGIDLEVTSAGGQLQTKLVAQEGAATELVRLRVEGATVEGVDGQRLQLSSDAGPLSFPLPSAEFPLEVEGRNGDDAAIRLVVPQAARQAQDATEAPQQDPAALLYSTLLGGGGDEASYDIALDGAGNAFVTGDTRSVTFPTTPGVFDPTHNGSPDVFVAKLNASGSALLYSTFLGGGGIEAGQSIALDGAGNAFVTGSTESSDFPVTPGAFDTTHNSEYDTFVTKIDSNGSTLLYSTFLGGESMDFGKSIALDSAGNAFVTGSTRSVTFPTTPGAFDPAHNGSQDAFVAKLNASGSALLYSTFLGGGEGDGASGIALDSTDNAFVTGYTTSSDFPTTAGAFDTTHNGFGDAFVMKLNASGSALLYSTFLGGWTIDDGFDIALDIGGNAFVTGVTDSADFPTTPGAFDTSYNGLVDAFVTKLNADGSALLYGTFLGGGTLDRGFDIALDGAGNAFVTGLTRSGNFPTTSGAFDTTLDGIDDAFVSKLDSSGSDLLYSTFLGGESMDYPESIALDSNGNAFVAGVTDSNDFPTTPGAFDMTHNGGTDTFVTALVLSPEPALQSLYLPAVMR